MDAPTTVRPKAASLPSGTLVELYIKLRDARAVRRAAFTAADESDKLKQTKLEGLLMQRFVEDGVDSVKTAAGTAFTEVVTTATVSDRPAFFQFCVDNDAEELMDVRASKTNIATYASEHDVLPPGITFGQTKIVRVRRA